MYRKVKAFYLRFCEWKFLPICMTNDWMITVKFIVL